MIENILTGVLSALIYSLIFYAKKYQKGEPFDPIKLASTLILGALIGFLLSTSNIPITEMNIETKLMTYTGAIAIFESIIKMLVRRGKEE